MTALKRRARKTGDSVPKVKRHPRHRSAPLVICEDHRGIRKLGYATEAAATRAALGVALGGRAAGRELLTVYHCDRCGQYHVGHDRKKSRAGQKRLPKG